MNIKVYCCRYVNGHAKEHHESMEKHHSVCMDCDTLAAFWYATSICLQFAFVSYIYIHIYSDDSKIPLHWHYIMFGNTGIDCILEQVYTIPKPVLVWLGQWCWLYAAILCNINFQGPLQCFCAIDHLLGLAPSSVICNQDKNTYCILFK